MNILRMIILSVAMLSLVLITGCREAKEGADVLADEVTGKNKIEKKLETEKKVQDAFDKVNKEQQEALKKLQE